MSKCKNCGNEFPQTVKFCSRCGALNDEYFIPGTENKNTASQGAALNSIEAAPNRNYQQAKAPVPPPPPAAPQAPVSNEEKPKAASPDYISPASANSESQSKPQSEAPAQQAQSPVQPDIVVTKTQNDNAGAPPPKEQLNTTGMLVWSIIMFCCCFPLLAIVSIIFTLLANSEKNNDIAKAKRYLHYAKICNIISLIIGIILAIFGGIYYSAILGVLRDYQQIAARII